MRKIEYKNILEKVGLYDELSTKNIDFMWVNDISFTFDEDAVKIFGKVPGRAYKMLTNYPYCEPYVYVDSLVIKDCDKLLKLLITLKSFEGTIYDYESIVTDINSSILQKSKCMFSRHECLGVSKEKLELALFENDIRSTGKMRKSIDNFVEAVNPFSDKYVDVDKFNDHLFGTDIKDDSYVIELKNNDNDDCVSFVDGNSRLCYQVKYKVDNNKTIILSYSIEKESLHENICICYYRDNRFVDYINYCFNTNTIDSKAVSEKIKNNLVGYLCFELDKAVSHARRITDNMIKGKKLIKK